ncbi:phage tail protein [Stigmatella hybrida]|uniref:phage tail protein n=1 Tax=Stigmatella hybrida TaxID=394097 RepID=UPI001CDA73F2|nr:tail fiber protein [Stigmatella hybrida]
MLRRARIGIGTLLEMVRRHPFAILSPPTSPLTEGIMTNSAAPATAVPLPIGTIIASILRPDSLPAGWLPCDGSPIPAEYQELITLLNSPNTPNLIGRTLIGAGNLSAASTKQTDGLNPEFSLLGPLLGGSLQISATGGESLHYLSQDEIPAHTHHINGTNFGVHQRSFSGADGANRPFENNPAYSLAGTDSTGGGKAHNNLQPYYAVTYIIFGGP